MFRIDFELVPQLEDSAAFSTFPLGHITISSHEGAITSKGRQPDQAMMIGIAIVVLLDGLRLLATDPSQSHYRFVGADSSFALDFDKISGARVRISDKGQTVVEVFSHELYAEVAKAARRFASLHPLSPDDPTASDFKNAMIEFASEVLAM